MPTPKKPQAGKPILKRKPRARAQPNSKTEEIARDLDNALSLSVLAQTEGGQVLVEGLMDDMVIAFDTAISQVHLLTHTELMTCIVKAGERLTLLRQILLADGEADMLKQILKEELAKEKEEKEAEALASVDNGMRDHSGTSG